LELLIQIARELGDGYELYLMLVYRSSTKHIFRDLISKSKDLNNVKFLTPVKREQIIEFCNQFDIGIIFFPPKNSNLKHALPNKFFEMIQSRLVLSVGPDEEMSGIVKDYSLGVVSESWDPKVMARSISGLNKDQIFKLKLNVHDSSKYLSSDGEMEKFNNAIESLISK
jgi:hypothetical protein